MYNSAAERYSLENVMFSRARTAAPSSRLATAPLRSTARGARARAQGAPETDV